MRQYHWFEYTNLKKSYKNNIFLINQNLLYYHLVVKISCLLKTMHNCITNNIILDISTFFKIYINEIRMTIKTTRNVIYKFNYYDKKFKKNVFKSLVLKFYS